MNRINSIFLCLLFIMLSLSSGCLDEIALVGDNEQIVNNLVVNGRLSLSEQSTILVQVSRVGAFDDLSGTRAVSDATVLIKDTAGNERLVPSLGDGTYWLNFSANQSAFLLSAGQAYQLLITTADGNQYESSPDQLEPVPTPEALSFSLVDREELNEQGNIVNKTYLDFFLDTPLNTATTETSFLKWQFEGCYRFIESQLDGAPPPVPRTCYVFQALDLENIVIFNGSTSNTNRLREFKLLQEPVNFRFASGFYLIATQQSLSQEAYQYWENVREIVGLGGNLFETSPGTIRGNIRALNTQEEVFGYFYATEEKVIRIKVESQDALSPPQFCPPNTTEPEICADCIQQANSTYIRPDYWE